MVQNVLIAVLMCSIGCACGRIERTRQCRALVSTANVELDLIERQLSNAKRDAKTFDEIATRYDALAVELAKLQFADATLQAATKEYVGILRSTALQTRSLGAAVKLQDQTRITSERHALEKLSRRAQLEVLKIDSRCHAP